MSAFSEYLERLKNEQDLSIVQIGNMANVDSSTLFRWMSGQSLPDSWERVERVLDCMQCTVSDKANIKMLFEKTSIGEKKWKSIKEIFKLIQDISNSAHKIVKNFVENEVLNVDTLEYLQSGIFQNKRQIIAGLSSFFHLDDQTLYFRFHTASDEIWNMLSAFPGNIELYYCKNSQNDTKYISVIRKMITLMQKNGHVKLFTMVENNTLCMGLSNILMIGNHTMQFTDDMMYGYYSDDKEFVQFLTKLFEDTKNHSRKIYQTIDQPLDTYQNGHSFPLQKIRALEYAPGLTIGLTRDLLEAAIYPEVENRRLFIESVIEQVIDGPGAFVTEYYSIFDKGGLLQFMVDGLFVAFPYEIYRPLNETERKEILGRVIKRIENEPYIHYLMVKEESLYLDDIYVEERRYVEKEIESNLMLALCEENKVKQITIQDKEIRMQFEDFFDWIVESDLVYTEAETLEFMKSLVD